MLDNQAKVVLAALLAAIVANLALLSALEFAMYVKSEQRNRVRFLDLTPKDVTDASRNTDEENRRSRDSEPVRDRSGRGKA